MKFVFFGYDFSLPILQRLLDDEHELISLCTFKCDNMFNFNREIIRCAKQHNVPYTLAKPTAKNIEDLTQAGAEFFLSCGYPYKIPPINESKAYGINMHPSLLPRGRGLMPAPHIIMHEPKVAGFTIHKLANEYDAGDILYQESIKLTDKDTVDSYSAKIVKQAPAVISKIVADLPIYWSAAQPQDHAKATSFTPPTEAMRTFDWSKGVIEIEKIGRAFGSFGSLAQIDGKMVGVFAYEIEKRAHEHMAGEVIEQKGDKIIVAAADGFVKLKNFIWL